MCFVQVFNNPKVFLCKNVKNKLGIFNSFYMKLSFNQLVKVSATKTIHQLILK